MWRLSGSSSCVFATGGRRRDKTVSETRFPLLCVLAVVLCSLSTSTCYAFPFLHGTHATARQQEQQQKQQKQQQQQQYTALGMSSGAENDPAVSAVRSLADYHEGEWRGRARSFTVTPDVAAGIVQRKVSPEYTVAVKIAATSTTLDPSMKKATPVGTEPSTGTVSLTETVSWGDRFSHRSIPLFASSGLLSSSRDRTAGSAGDLDVDDVDASYSLDLTKPTDFPSVLSGLNGNNDDDHAKRLKFVVEHCIAAAENRRCRCFAIYGEDDSLLRVVVADEKRVEETDGAAPRAGSAASNDGKNSDNVLTISDIIEMENDVNRLVDKIAASMNQGPSSETSKNSPPPQVDDIEDNDDGDDESSYSVPAQASRLDALEKSMSGAKEKETQDLSPYDISLLEVTNGVWLGDMIIRGTPGVAASPNEGGPGNGFGKNPSSAPSSFKPTRGFAEWDAGVQKIAWRWMWNFEEEIRQVVDAGKTLGTSMDGFLKKSLAGNVCVDESFSRRKPKDERMVYIDWGQDSVGFLLGPFSVQVPRYVNFDPTAATSRAAAVTKPFYTEFGMFQNAGRNTDGVVDVGEKPKDDEICCSKIGRLYNYEGRLKQGCTSFYTFKPFDVDGEDDDEEY